MFHKYVCDVYLDGHRFMIKGEVSGSEKVCIVLEMS